MESIEEMRDAALAGITLALKGDLRFDAAWLAGSFGRGEEDAYSDLDVWLAVDAAYAEELCRRPQPTNAGTTAARLRVVETPGIPVIIHEQHANAPSGGAFTAVIYATGLAVDWTFVPALGAARGASTRLLFDRVGIPVAAVAGVASGNTA